MCWSKRGIDIDGLELLAPIRAFEIERLTEFMVDLEGGAGQDCPNFILFENYLEFMRICECFRKFMGAEESS